MLDQMQQMMGNPQAREMMFGMIAQQVAKAPPERREALSRVTVSLEKAARGLRLDVSRSEDPAIETIIQQALNGWTEMVAKGFQAMGFQVEIVE